MNKKERAKLEILLNDSRKSIEDALKALRGVDKEEQRKRRRQPKGTEQFRG